MKLIKYAGVGSRACNATELGLIQKISQHVANRNWLLRSGGAKGADSAFEWGCQQALGHKEIFIPCSPFNGRQSGDMDVFNIPFDMDVFETYVSKIHPNPQALLQPKNRFALLAHTRNVYQILGPNVDDPVDLVIYCANEHNGVVAGGTATAVHLARSLEIPTYNLRYNHVAAVDAIKGIIKAQLE